LIPDKTCPLPPPCIAPVVINVIIRLHPRSFVVFIFILFSAQMPYGGAPAQNPVPEQSQAAFVPNLMNQYPANPVQPADPNMGMNAVAKTNIPESTQVRVHVRLKWI